MVKKSTPPPEEPRGLHPEPFARLYRELESWIRAELRSHLAEGEQLPSVVELSLRLPIRLSGRGRQAAERCFREALVREVAMIRERLLMDQLGYREGHMHCHWCESSLCEHSRPPDSRAVFVGFQPIGKPHWRDYASWVVERRDPRLDRLYLKSPLPLAIYLPGKELVRELLAPFGKHSTPYRIVAQVSCGNFQIPRPSGRQFYSLAVTAQVIERRIPGGDPRYSLNLLSTTELPEDLPSLLAERLSPLLSEFVENLRRCVRELQTRLRESRKAGRRLSLSESRELACRALERAPQQLDKYLRRRGRRTLHAENRRQDPQRPTASAHSDALGAESEDLFFDRVENTVIVRGPRNRVHVFRNDGTHITSIVYPGSTIRDRVQQRRWVPLEKNAREQLRTGIAAHSQILADETEKDNDSGNTTAS